MKTIKIKIQISKEQESLFNQYAEELKWLWNLVLSNQLHNHCLDWYAWAGDKKRQDKLGIFPPFDLDGIIECPLKFGSSGFIGASCPIAKGGNYWTKDESVKIPYKHKGEIKYKHGCKLAPGDIPWTRLSVKPHEYRFMDMFDAPFKKPDDFDRIGKLNTIRRSQGLPDLQIKSDYISGLIRKDFVTAWKAFLDPKLLERKKLRFKRNEDKITTLTNNQKPPVIDFEKNTLSLSGIGTVKIADKNYKQRLQQQGMIPRTYAITQNVSGYYVCITIADASIEEQKKLEKKLNKVKKEYGKESQEYNEARSQIESIKDDAKQRDRKPQKGLSVGIDPGVKAVIATDHGALFVPNLTRDRIEIHIEKLQSNLANIKLINDARLGKNRPKTKNEIKLQAKISRLHERAANCTSAFNHKLSTRIARTYTIVCWEDSKIKNMIKRTSPKLSGEHDGYEHNGASAKTGLNRILRLRSLGDLKAKTKSKVESYGGEFKEPKPHNSSQECSACGKKGHRLNQHKFVCLNEECSEFNIIKNADSNAAKNHKRNAGVAVSQGTKHQMPKLRYASTKRYKDSYQVVDNQGD
jgi:transposase